MHHFTTWTAEERRKYRKRYQNKYELYEWIQEAIVKGMADVHEIQRYARQKEISLYGA